MHALYPMVFLLELYCTVFVIALINTTLAYADLQTIGILGTHAAFDYKLYTKY
jgi:hypothetical protein